MFLYKTNHLITSKKLKDAIKKLNKIKNDEKFVKAVFLFVARKYKIAHNPITFIINLPKAFWHNPNKIIEKDNSIASCHVQNLMIETILLNSKRFSERDIKRKITFTLVIHQYLEINVQDKTLQLDPWAYDEGIPYGKHLNIINFIKYSLLNLHKEAGDLNCL